MPQWVIAITLMESSQLIATTLALSRIMATLFVLQASVEEHLMVTWTFNIRSAKNLPSQQLILQGPKSFK